MDNNSQKNNNSGYPILGNSICNDLYDIRKNNINNSSDLLSSAIMSNLSKKLNNISPSSPRNSLLRVQEWQNLQRRMEKICNNNPMYQALNNTLNQEYSSMSASNQSQHLDQIPTYTPPERQYSTQLNIDGQGKRILNGSITHDFGNQNIGILGGYSPGNINVGTTYKKNGLSLEGIGTVGSNNSFAPHIDYKSEFGDINTHFTKGIENSKNDKARIDWILNF